MVQLSEMIRDDGVCVVSVIGELDLASVEEFSTTARRSAALCAALEVDLGAVSFIDSTGLSALIKLREETGARGVPLTLANVSPATHRLLQVTGLLDVFHIRAGSA